MSDGADSEQPVIHVVDRVRLQHGLWNPRRGKTPAEGDIVASYSADRIASGQPVRKPFNWQGSLWVCVALDCRGGATTAEAFRLIQAEVFSRKPVSYAEKVADAEAARQDPNGFYHGMVVTHAGNSRVLSGPRALFVAGQPEEPEQMSLFGSAMNECSPG